MGKQKPPKHHHYLPIHYQKGFLNSNGEYFLYDKLKDEIKPETKPKKWFGINDLNTLDNKGKKEYHIETNIFKDVDEISSQILNKIRKQSWYNAEDLTEYEKVSFALVLSHLFWRIPKSSTNLKEILDKSREGNDFFDFEMMETNKETQESNRAKLLNFLKIDKNVQKLLKLFYPLTSVESGELLFIGLKWKVFYLFNSSSLITGDNPFARKLDGIDNNGLLGEFIFPISKDKLLLITEEEPKFVESFFALYLNLTILFQSERFICCDNKEYLDKLILIYKDFQKENLCADIKNLLFDRLKYISSFNSKEDFFVEINKDVKY